MANALGVPPDYMIAAGKERGIPVAALVGAKEHAIKQVHAGVDLIVAQGTEAGGHCGEVTTLVLIPEVLEAIADVPGGRDIPVLAAGGIVTGRQMAATVALGAAGAWTGSVWLTTEEAETHPVVKEKFLAATSSDTLRSRSRTGKPARQLRSAWTEEWDSPASPGPLPMPLQPILIGEASTRIDRAAKDLNSGAGKLANYFVGQIVGSMNEVKPAGRVVMDMVEEFIDAMQRVGSMME
jgi:NAD(P)H-dependent flavin oxidoreductase YrpB (nitropropane dioxygenase family)